MKYRFPVLFLIATVLALSSGCGGNESASKRRGWRFSYVLRADFNRNDPPVLIDVYLLKSDYRSGFEGIDAAEYFKPGSQLRPARGKVLKTLRFPDDFKNGSLQFQLEEGQVYPNFSDLGIIANIADVKSDQLKLVLPLDRGPWQNVIWPKKKYDVTVTINRAGVDYEPGHQ